MPSKITPNKRSAYIHLSEELMIEVFKVDSWEDLNEHLWKYSRDSTLNWVTDTTYRGLDRDYGNLKTSLQRLGGNLKIKEQKLLNAFRKHARTDLQFGESDWDVMLLGRHYGLPTRLLDWTVSPLTALFFAVEHVEHDDEDGVIWCVQRSDTNSLLPRDLLTLLQEHQGTTFSVEELKERFKSVKDLDLLTHECVLFFEPPGVSPRIINQFPVFSVMPGVESDALAYFDQKDVHYRKVMVSSRLKKEVRGRLLVMNVSDRTMYPGLDGISRWLKAWLSRW
jgi:FRG domain-containing protein